MGFHADFSKFRGMGSHKTLRIKTKLGKKQKQNRTLPHWTRLRTGNKIRWLIVSKLDVYTITILISGVECNTHEDAFRSYRYLVQKFSTAIKRSTWSSVSVVEASRARFSRLELSSLSSSYAFELESSCSFTNVNVIPG
ncbi:hypothetical protein AHF37_03699 [Paragonimus kellicotti]|nr:hypothetical protein AHF37_03699 [Paragonimus kellicotti]